MANLLFYVQSSTPAAIGGIDEYTKLMMHMDGADDGTVFTDDSASSHTVNRFNAVTKTGTKQFGTAAGYFDGSGDYLSVPDSDDWTFGSDDFTIDWWVYHTSIDSSFQTYFSIFDNSNNQRSFILQLNETTGNLWFAYSLDGLAGGSLRQVSTPGGLSATQWHHIAVVRNGTIISIYVDGNALAGTLSAGTDSIFPPVDPLLVGAQYGPTDYVKGYIDELRISKGIARWTSNFTPESGPYTE